MKILFVCIGNICRSPLGEGILRQLTINNDKMLIDSAAMFNYHIGSPPDKRTIKVAHEHGIDITDQRARLINSNDIERYDIIYAMADDVYDLLIKKFGPNKKIKLITEEISNFPHKSVPDPYYGDYSEFQDSYKIIDTLCNAIVKKYDLNDLAIQSSNDTNK